MAGFYGDLAAKAGSDNESQISDVDPAEMAKMLEGLDDMESDLFGSSLKNRKGKSLASPTAQAKSALKSPTVDDGEKQSKSRVTFGISDKDRRSTPRKSQTFDDFDIDDPLADLLSDEDSEVKKKTKRASPARSKLSTDAQDQHTVNTNKENKLRSKTVADLFGLDDDDNDEKHKAVVGSPSLSAPAKPIKENPSPPKSKFLTNDLESSNVRSTPLRTTKKSEDVIDTKVTNPSPRPRSEGVKFDNDDILDSMGFGGDRNRGSRRGLGSGKPTQSRPKSVLDELLGKHPAPEKEEEFIINHLEVKKSASKPELREDSGVSFGDYAPTVTTNREGRRLSSRRNTTALGDPVGLFSSPTTPQRHSFQEGMGEKFGFEASPMKGRPTSSERFGEEMNSLSPQHRSSTTNQGTEPVPRSRHAAKQSPARSNPLTPQKSIAVADDLPDWLGGGGVKKKQTLSEVPTQHPAPVEPPPPPPPQDHPPREQQAPVVQSSAVVGELFLNSQLEQQIVLALQRQEAALMAANGLKAHEAQLNEVQRRQQFLLEQQETQLKQLVERQVERQRQLEETLRMQQERITGHMQALLSEPPGLVIMEPPKVMPSALAAPPAQTTVQTPTVTSASVSEPVLESLQTSAPAPPLISVAVETEPLNNEELVETQVTLQKCELQKTYLEAKLENLETKHKEEVQLLEECYKRQMSILEEAIVNQEARLRAENQRLEADYKDRILKMKELHAQLVEEHERQLTALQQERLADLQKLREQQQAMLEHVRQAQKAETSAIKDASEHVISLQSTVEILSRSAGGLGELQGKLEEQQRLQSSAREAAIKAKEEDLRALQERLEKQQETVEKEDRRLKGLEATLSRHRHELEEERQSQRREMEKFQVEQQNLESQRQQLESMKLAFLEEQKAWRQQFSEERMSLAAEKSRLETMARLHSASSKQDEVAQLKAEAEAQLAVAHEAAERAQLERTSLKEQQRRLDSERRRLTEMEHDLTVRAREVEGLAQIAKSTRNDSIEALAEATRMERTTSERSIELQQQLKDLQEREQRLTQEKLNLSQERLSLRKSRDQKLCSSCKGLLVRQSSSPDHSRAPSITFSERFVDPKLVIMKLAAEREREALESNFSALHSISK